jgi:hypothetical protein
VRVNDDHDPDYVAACREVDEIAPAAPPITPARPILNEAYDRHATATTRPVATCGVCRRPVDRMEQNDDLFTGAIVLSAFCHGQVETVQINREELLAASGVYLCEAFVGQDRPRLPSPDPSVAVKPIRK